MILNIIIHDKMDYCNKNAICFETEVQNVNLDFMEPIDVTTIFGNILDNAVEACKTSEQRKLFLKVYPFNGLIYVQLSNTFSGQIRWDSKGKPISAKGEQHGIGLGNVEKALMKYRGNLELSVTDDMFVVEIMFSQS